MKTKLFWAETFIRFWFRSGEQSIFVWSKKAPTAHFSSFFECCYQVIRCSIQWNSKILQMTNNQSEFNSRRSVRCANKSRKSNKVWKLQSFFTIKKHPSGLEKLGCHAMILRWSYHDHGETWPWSCYDDGISAMFLCMSLSCYDYHVFHVFC